jgi:hypothetical protein
MIGILPSRAENQGIEHFERDGRRLVDPCGQHDASARFYLASSAVLADFCRD